MPRPKPQVSQLHFYPIKSCAGVALESAEIDERGIKDDRSWLIVNKDDVFLTQRDLPKMCLIQTKIVPAPRIDPLPEHMDDEGGETSERALLLSAPGMPALLVPEITLGNELSRRKVRVWRDECSAVDQGLGAEEWLSQFLERDVRLMKISRRDTRVVKPVNRETLSSQIAFQDGYPFLIISEESLQELNSRLDEPLPMNRFRPNIVIKNTTPFAEDNWKLIRIGRLQFQIDKPCARCVITTIDQTSAVPGREPLKSLAKFRMVDQHVMFGQNAVHLSSGSINLADEVDILEEKGKA